LDKKFNNLDEQFKNLGKKLSKEIQILKKINRNHGNEMLSKSNQKVQQRARGYGVCLYSRYLECRDKRNMVQGKSRQKKRRKLVRPYLKKKQAKNGGSHLQSQLLRR
jgi:hypothetical protein